mmetsp:Transcript_39761/g.91970  ORF Transcript_39761/g.91970 Transcript_39761/m.91970 type:complete len:233 (-) Transcript_39761:183-881(-)
MGSRRLSDSQSDMQSSRTRSNSRSSGLSGNSGGLPMRMWLHTMNIVPGGRRRCRRQCAKKSMRDCSSRRRVSRTNRILIARRQAPGPSRCLVWFTSLSSVSVSPRGLVSAGPSVGGTANPFALAATVGSHDLAVTSCPRLQRRTTWRKQMAKQACKLLHGGQNAIRMQKSPATTAISLAHPNRLVNMSKTRESSSTMASNSGLLASTSSQRGEKGSTEPPRALMAAKMWRSR